MDARDEIINIAACIRPVYPLSKAEHTRLQNATLPLHSTGPSFCVCVLQNSRKRRAFVVMPHNKATSRCEQQQNKMQNAIVMLTH